MLTVTIGNSVCTIAGVTTLQLVQLRKVCSYVVTSGKRVKRKGKDGKEYWTFLKKRHHLMEPKGDFPTGILYRVQDLIAQKGWSHKIVDGRKRPKLYQLGDKSLYIDKPYESYVEQVEAALAAFHHGRGIIVGPTGVGKSRICEEILDVFRVPALIVVPTTELKRQLTASLRAAFGDHMVGPLGKRARPKCPISVENVDALDPNVKLEGVDLVMIDEYHHSAAETYRALNMKSWKDVYFKIGLTATPFRSNTEERLALESVLAEVIYEIPYQLAVEKKYIAPLEAYYVDLPKKQDTKSKGGWKKKSGTKPTYHDSYISDVVNNDLRNEIICNMFASLLDNKLPTLVLVKQIEHGNVLRDLMLTKGYDVPFAEGTSELKSSDIAAFNNGSEDGLLGTTGVIGEGVDTKRAEWAILAGGGKSKNQFMQNVGRVFRMFAGKDSGKIVLIRDQNNKWLLEHFNKCLKYLWEEYGIVAEKLDLGT